ncbi:ABC transporter ATP-binding protein [Oceanotoga teriensis]|uniref:ABC transporter ATP-binding protein n=1 Tax=Oceanotoga teriensis TaxID=515440 RepID=UPI00271355D0|nr:ABC transporter ATP-binding protein [Oceanotoga teriensis]MDO7977059.1 ABC transporter ATP-binding protein/permease [Oceanotoga teriensis]
MLGNIKQLLGKQSKKLKMPIFLLVIDSVFYGIFIGVMYFVLLDLIQDTFSVEKIKEYTWIMIISFIIRTIISSIGYSGIQIQGARAIESMRIKMGEHLRNLPLGYFNKNSIGEISNIMTNDLQDFEKVITHNTSELIKISIISIYLLIITFFIDFSLGLIQLIIVLGSLPLMFYGGKRASKIGKGKKKIIAVVISRMVEYLNGIKVFKSHNMVGEKFERLEKSFKDFRKESIRTEVAIVPYVLAFQTLIDLSFPLMLIISTTKFINGNINNIYYFTFVILNLALTYILRGFSAQYGEFRYLKLASEKLIKTYNEKEISYEYENHQFKNYDIEFENVCFSYEEDDPILKDVSFKAKEGTMTALIGPSGSGKTTITSLIARFWDIQSGKIKIGDMDISKLKPDNILQNVSMVFQEVYLLNDTIYNNIKIGNQKATKEKIVEAAKIANCHDFIESLENGYDTIVGEGGSTLSGGEKQRISIARAILKDAPIILLDEATASLDADNELEIRKSIDKLIKNKTVIVIAHRLNTIKDSDQIIVLNEGKIEEIGDHNILMENKARYYNMYTEMEKAKLWTI